MKPWRTYHQYRNYINMVLTLVDCLVMKGTTGEDECVSVCNAGLEVGGLV